MKKYFSFCLFIGAGWLSQQVHGQTNAQQQDTVVRYYARLANSTNEADKASLEAQLYQLLKSDKEKDWLTARRFFWQLKKPNVSDSIAKAAKVQFPMGQVVRDEEVPTVYNETDPVKKEKLYQVWVKKFPPQKFGADRIIYDYARNSISTAYAKANNVKKAMQYADMIETAPWKGEGWASVAGVLKQNGHLKEAEALYKKAIANSYKFMTTNRNDPGAGFAAIGFPGYSATLAGMYLQQKRYDEALKYIKVAHDSAKTARSDINGIYAEVLTALGNYQQAFNVIDELVKAGQATKQMKETLKTLYPKVKGSNAGYDEYLASVDKIMAEKIRKDIAKQMINQPAIDFVLKDVDGNTVSLADLRGKVVVLDFWATWCGPCKRSFPAMKTAMERYKNNPDVQFLFIHTWEKEEHATDSAKSYVVKNNYPFRVLMDLKDADGINKVVESYKVSGIPTKFVIDRKGNIRFKFTGAGGGEDAAVEEIAAMVEMAEKG